MKLTCAVCQKEFERIPALVKRAKVHTCSNACRVIARTTRKSIQCAECGTEIVRKQYRIARAEKQFCNIKCKAQWLLKNQRGDSHHQYNRVDVICATCGKIFRRKPSEVKEKNYCSYECTAKSLTMRVGEKAPGWVPSVKVACNWCGAALERKPNELIDRTTGKQKERFYCNHKCFAQWKSHNWSGENSPSWRGGSTPYYGANWKRQKRLARARDNHTCQRCGITEEQIGKALEVHHIKRFADFTSYKEANRLANLVCLCRGCHMIVEYHEPEWSLHRVNPVSIG